MRVNKSFFFCVKNHFKMQHSQISCSESHNKCGVTHSQFIILWHIVASERTTAVRVDVIMYNAFCSTSQHTAFIKQLGVYRLNIEYTNPAIQVREKVKSVLKYLHNDTHYSPRVLSGTCVFVSLCADLYAAFLIPFSSHLHTVSNSCHLESFT